MTVAEKKYSYFLIAVIGCTTILSIPMIYGHIFHQGHLLHFAIHEIGFVLASFLTVMALVSYKKTKIKRMVFSSAGFVLLHKTLGTTPNIPPPSNLKKPVSIVYNCMLVIFSLTKVRNDIYL